MPAEVIHRRKENKQKNVMFTLKCAPQIMAGQNGQNTQNNTRKKKRLSGESENPSIPASSSSTFSTLRVNGLLEPIPAFLVYRTVYIVDSRQDYHRNMKRQTTCRFKNNNNDNQDNNNESTTNRFLGTVPITTLQSVN